MDFVTNTNVVVDYEKNANNRAAVLAYDTLIAAKKNKERKEKKLFRFFYRREGTL